MGKGIWELAVWSRWPGDIWLAAVSLWCSPLLAPPTGAADVGDGKTSARRDDASFLSLFQMVLLQGKELEPEGARVRPADEAESEPQAADSADGVVGCDAVGDMELLANDPFRTRLFGACVVQEGRRVGFCC